MKVDKMNRIVTAIDDCLLAPVTSTERLAFVQFTKHAAGLLDLACTYGGVSWVEGKQNDAEVAERNLVQLFKGELHHLVIPDTSNAEFHPIFLEFVPVCSSVTGYSTRCGIIRAYHDIVGHAGLLDNRNERTFFDFSFTGELQASLCALRHLENAGVPDTVLSIAAADSIAQTIYHHVTGVFPAFQVPTLHADLSFSILKRVALDILGI